MPIIFWFWGGVLARQRVLVANRSKFCPVRCKETGGEVARLTHVFVMLKDTAPAWLVVIRSDI